jgi:predicted ATP-grasp superfamily ATP-dependent carboligase
MNLFIYEYTCAAGTGPGCEGLQAEGWAMLASLLDDFGRLPGITLATLLAESLPQSCPNGVCRRTRAGDEARAFGELAGWADYTVLVAPEFDGLLETRCAWVLEAGGRLLGPSPAAVGLTADKLTLASHLQQCAVPTPETDLLEVQAPLPPFPFPIMSKPRFGAGSLATVVVRDRGEWQELTSCAGREATHGELIVQPFLPGQAASVAFLVGPKRQLALLPASQRLSQDGRFHYLGGKLPLPAALGRRAVAVAGRAVQAVPELLGYVGVDVVLGAAADGSTDFVIEINPRLTTSYVGLRRLAETNLAQVLFAVALDKEVPPLAWRPGVVEFDTSGRVVVWQA